MPRDHPIGPASAAGGQNPIETPAFWLPQTGFSQYLGQHLAFRDENLQLRASLRRPLYCFAAGPNHNGVAAVQDSQRAELSELRRAGLELAPMLSQPKPNGVDGRGFRRLQPAAVLRHTRPC